MVRNLHVLTYCTGCGVYGLCAQQPAPGCPSSLGVQQQLGWQQQQRRDVVSTGFVRDVHGRASATHSRLSSELKMRQGGLLGPVTHILTLTGTVTECAVSMENCLYLCTSHIHP